MLPGRRKRAPPASSGAPPLPLHAIAATLPQHPILNPILIIPYLWLQVYQP